MNQALFSTLRLVAGLVFFCICSTQSITAQDVIYKKDGKVIRVKIVEIGETSIRYTEYTDQDGIVFTMARSLIREIEFESGSIYEERDPGNDDAYFYDDSRSNLKINFFRLGDGEIMVTYEQSISSNQSWEVTSKVFLDDDPFSTFGGGVGLQGGYKIKTGTIFKGGDYRPKHLLAGGYIRPGAGFTTRSLFNTERFFMTHVGLDIGKQWVFSDILSIDLFGGFHYYSYSESGSDRPDSRFFDAEISAGNLFGISNRAVSFGLRVGYVFNSRADKEGIKRSRGKKRNVIN